MIESVETTRNYISATVQLEVPNADCCAITVAISD